MNQAFLPPILCALTCFLVERHQHLVTHRGLGCLRLRPGLHLHHVVYVHHFRIPAVRGICSGLHDLFTLHNFGRAEPSVGQDVREHRSALVAIVAPVPFILHKYGHKVRAMSKNAQNKA